MSGRRALLLFTAASLGAVVLLAVGCGLYRGMCRSSFFRLATVEVTGRQRTTERQIIEAGGIELHSSLLALSVDKICRNIEKLPWIEHVEIQRDWPGRIVIKVRERQPVALANVAGVLHYMDGSGVVFSKVSPGDDHDFPVISGLGQKYLTMKEPGEAVKSALQFLRYVRRNDPVLPRQNISEIAIQPAGDLVVYLADRPFPIYLGCDRMESSYYRLVKVLSWLYRKKEFEFTEYIRLDYLPEKVLVGKAT
ncbi:MAG: FtsQ-type POTRA domain-containing protein [Deltaproteobacteria bacterium]